MRLPLRFVLLLLLALHAGGATADVPPGHVASEIAQARLAGQGAFRWFGLKLYDARLWVGPRGLLAGEKFALELRYARELQGKRIAAASRDEMEKLGAGTPEQRSAWLARMEALFPDVRDGSRITGVYLPDEGARFYFDGKPLGEVKDAQFGKAFFAIWLDSRTSAPGLRDALMAGASSAP